MFIGLMGLKDNGMLVTPNGHDLFRVPLKIGALIQRVQHWCAQRTWR